MREFAAGLEGQGDLFYKTPLEKNITLRQKTSAERKKRGRFYVADITDFALYVWPHADDYLTTLKPYLEFVYTTWFTLLTIFMFGVMAWMWTDKFGEIWSDSFAFYNFTAKSSWDLVEFWFLFGAMAFFHETAHGLTCKHFGARVESMQFMLMFFAPTFMCDCTQVWIVGDKKARISTTIAGIWARSHDLRGRDHHLVGHGDRHVHPRLCLQSHHGDRHRRDHPQPQPARSSWMATICWPN